ncbi:zinc finger FYVE domain-containing protein 26 isoform X3 [Esox lucius]|uniref:zinc finger FYVE domain-containing protein 26 isoform X3 n=1 Tax=Esox lucius TaxID=8010 RepID=UPI001476B8B5|nr:zinc finger FYVE domain-containing protein 26 isoform X3 [Esox lucius]
MHPYGCDPGTSLRELFRFFTRCLQGGEWELSAACVPQLGEAGGEVSRRLRDIIKAIITHPHLLPWKSVGSPHRLAWFWLQVLEKWTKKEVSRSVRRELEFLLLLEELGEEVPDTTLQGLHQAFQTTQSEERKAPGESPETGDALSPRIESCLQALLENKRPRLALALIRFLEDHPGASKTKGHSLQDTFIRYLIERLEGQRPGTEPRPEKVDGWAEELCTVLALMPWRPERGGGQLEALCEALWRAREGCLREERVLSSMLRPNCHALLSLYSSTALRLDRDRLLRQTPGAQVDLSEAERLLLGLCCHSDRRSVWKTIYFECLSSGKHFLEQALVTALDLVKREEFSRLKDLLKGEFQPLSRLLLLLGWSHCQSLASAQTLLHLLHHDQAPANDCVLREFAKVLSSQLGVLEWCAKNNPAIPREALLGQLHTLDSHSALHVLHSLTPLARCEESRVLDLLNTLPKPTTAESGELADSPTVQRNLVLYRGFCAMKYALYALCVNAHKYSGCSDCVATNSWGQHPEKCPSQHPEKDPSQHPEKCSSQHPEKDPSQHPEKDPSQHPEKDPSQHPEKDPSQHPEKDPSQHPEKDPSQHPEKDPSQASATSEDCPPWFQHCLFECQMYLEAVPAMYRLELLENIFSLLFLSSADFTLRHNQVPAASTEPTGQPEHTVEGSGAGPESSASLGGRGEEDQSKGNQHQPPGVPSPAPLPRHLDLSHLTAGCRGFLVDLAAMGGFLRLLRESLEGLVVVGQRAGQEEGRALAGEAEVAESLGCSVTAETFGARLQRLSKRTAEAQWRLQIVTSNQARGNPSDGLPQRQASRVVSPTAGLKRSGTGVRRGRRSGRNHSDGPASAEPHDPDVSASASDGGGGEAGRTDWEVCPHGDPHSWVIPAMLSPPDSLLMACIRRENYMEARQVSLMFGLEGSLCCAELVFMERYRQVLEELARVERKMDTRALSSSSSSEGLGASAAPMPSPGRSRLGSSGRSTLQAIESAAAAGMAFYSLSDVADRLLSTPARPVPSLEEGYWLGRCVPDPPGTGLLHPLLEELSPPAMAAFDLACCHCQLWKTSRQLLDTAERRLLSSLEGRGLIMDSKVTHSEGIRGFPAVLQQISKILSHAASSNKGAAKTEAAVEDHAPSSPFGCCIQEVLLSCHPGLSEEGIAARLSLAQRLETTLQTLATATDTAGQLTYAAVDVRAGGSLLAALVEQAGLKQSELDSHPVRSSMKQLLCSLDQMCPFEPQNAPCRPDYVRSFLDYVNTLASVLVRSLASGDQGGEVKLGNPLLVLLQAPSQLLSYLLFDRQVSPDRMLALLQQEGIHLSVQQVIVQHCCESLPVWDWSTRSGMEASPGACPASRADPGGPGQGPTRPEGAFGVDSLAALLQYHAHKHMPMLGNAEPTSPAPLSSESESPLEDARPTTPPIIISSSPPSPSRTASYFSPTSSFLLTTSALAFLKSCSPLVATLVCLCASRGGASRMQPSGWLVFRGATRKDNTLDGEQVSREGDVLLREFPILRAYLQVMAQPVLGTPLGAGEESTGTVGGGGLGASLCGKPLAGLLLSGPQEPAAQAVAAEAFQEALASRDLTRALNLLELYGQGCSQEGALRDQLLAWSALEDDDDRTDQLFRVQDPSLRARVALQGLQRWPLGPALDLLEFCLSHSNMEASLRGQLELRKRELDIYQQMLSMQPALPWATWQELKAESERDPESVLSRMLEAREYSLCAQWVVLYPVSDQLRLQLQTEHLLHLLEKGLMDDAFQLLDGLSDLGLEVCEGALDRRPGLAACHFLADYLTLHFQSQMSPARRRHIYNLHLGSKILLTLPPASREDYFSLLSEPLLLLEQLLMNLKVDWAVVAVRTLQNLLLGQEAGFTTQDIDKLLSSYASKALDFPYAASERSRSDSVISLHNHSHYSLISLQDDQSPAQDSCPSTPSRIETPPPAAGSGLLHTSSSSVSLDRGSTGKRAQGPPTPFRPPDKPPGRKDWVPDAQQNVCMVCQRERFTMFNRRHHCRRCGRLVCHACSDHRMAVEGCTEEEPEVRVCDQCHSFYHADSDNELEQAEVAGSPGSAEGELDGMIFIPEIPQRQFHLSTNPAENLQIQTQFYYEQAPSTSLCVAILSLHSDQTACGHQLIGHCRSLSRKLTNPEVDARLLTDVMHQLLFSAKLMFVKVGRSQDLVLCDSYISKVDVLKILVTANYKYIPSLDDILETTAVTRLRNQLLEAEYYQLAVEVSTKSGLDPGGVWQAWGMASLKAGNLLVAREKFSRCLKAPVDKNQISLGPRLLREIISHLESTVRPALAKSSNEDILISLRELEDALCGPGRSFDGPEGGSGRGGVLYQESLYYLSSYGTHLAIISFLMRHDNMKEALQHLLTKRCPEEVFLEGVLQPSLEKGRLGTLQGLLETLDPGLEVCSRYLIASCHLLQRRGHFNTLYQVQQFMMDHVRAAMTCIRFFTHGAVSYVQLGDQQRWLVRAKEHLRTYLQEQQGGRGGTAARKKSSTNPFRKKMSSSDVSRHMNTIELQLEVTRFLHRCEMSSSKHALPSSSSNSPPTLFGPSAMKIDVACKVMLGGKNIEEGFGIAYRVIQDFQLEALVVYVRAGQRLMRQRQYGAVRQLLKCVGESGTGTKNDCDTIVLSCVSIADKGPNDAKELEGLIQETKSTETKIKAYLQVSKLRAAYLLAVKLDVSRAGPLVQEVLLAAEDAGDSVMQDICRQWLSEHQGTDRTTPAGLKKTPPGRPNAR